METKPGYKSLTLISQAIQAIAGGALILAPSFNYEIPPEIKGVLMTLAAGGGVGVITGRLNPDIKPVVKKVEQPTPELVIQPNFAAIAELPSAEYASVVPDSPIEDPLESVDNEEDDTLDIDFSKLEGKYYLVAQVDTKLKTSPAQASELASVDYREVGQWQRIDIDSWNFLAEKNEHIEVRIDEYSNINGGKFYAYAPHFRLFNVFDKEVAIKKATSPIVVIDKNLTEIKLPGYSSKFFLENHITYVEDGKTVDSHFTWAEALRGGSRMPSEKHQVDNMIAVARMLDKIRAFNGNRPMVITSWLRPDRPVNINRQVGGVANSRHITGDGVDFTIPRVNLYDLQERLKPFCKQHNLGLGLGAKRGFIHIDLNGWRCWSY